MNTIEQDAERVRAVHAALGDPKRLEVWVVKWKDKHNDGIEIYRTKNAAKDMLLYLLDADRNSFDSDVFDSVRIDITDDTADEYSNDDEVYASYFSYTIGNE